MAKKITIKEVETIQKLWGDSLIKIGETFLNKGDFILSAESMINKLYGFNSGQVLFKPTKAAEKQFRNTHAGALSYFIGNNKNYPEDQGFALQPWIKIRFENSGFILNEDYALVSGNYFFTDLNKNEIKVEFAFGYFKDSNGDLRINLHHSSLPYSD